MQCNFCQLKQYNLFLFNIQFSRLLNDTCCHYSSEICKSSHNWKLKDCPIYLTTWTHQVKMAVSLRECGARVIKIDQSSQVKPRRLKWLKTQRIEERKTCTMQYWPVGIWGGWILHSNFKLLCLKAESDLSSCTLECKCLPIFDM